MENTILWQKRSYTKEQFILAWESSKTKSDVLRKLNIPIAGGNMNTITRTAKMLNLDDKHFDRSWPFRLENPNRVVIPSPALTKEALISKLNKDNYISNSHNIKLQLYKHGLKTQECEECGLIEWRGKPAPLALDHIDGDRSNNDLSNLRILCYNCHGQTETFSGKKNIQHKKKSSNTTQKRSIIIKPKVKNIDYTCHCGSKKSRDAKECLSCSQSKIKSQVANKYPELNELISMIQSSTYVAVASQLGISDNALKKHLKKRLPESHPVLNLKPRAKG